MSLRGNIANLLREQERARMAEARNRQGASKEDVWSGPVGSQKGSPLMSLRLELHRFLSTAIRGRRSGRISDIDSALLSTCRVVYDEASPILYQNLFVFTDPHHISAFQGNMLQDPKLVEKRARLRTQRITRLGLTFSGRYLRPLRTRKPEQETHRSAAWWCDSVVGIFQETNRTSRHFEPLSLFESEAASSFRNVEVLELNFVKWVASYYPKLQLPANSLARITGDIGWKVKRIKTTGLGHYTNVKESIEEALLLNPPPRTDTNESQPTHEYDDGWDDDWPELLPPAVSEANNIFPNLTHLELRFPRFTSSRLDPADQGQGSKTKDQGLFPFPQVLLEGIENSGWKLDKLTIRGLENFKNPLLVNEIIEKALLK
ncbi:hypothetical protein MMC30_000347 [Trapelia coarctata]|nr:hypothetical protein [Trapelia coarctata]